MPKKLFFKVEPEYSGQRIDKYLARRLGPDYSRAFLQKIILNKSVAINEKFVKIHQKIRANDEILITLPDMSTMMSVAPVDIPIDIIYEDDYLLIVNKPAGMVVHPAPGHFNDTLVNALLFHTNDLSDINGPSRAGIVHRLDKDTSGSIVIAKNNDAHRKLAIQFKRHTIKRIYIAVVWGRIEHDEGVVNAPISRSPVNRKKMSVMYSSSKEAQTFYRVINRTKFLSALEIFPKTGRTHQIRVHLAHIGYPIVGDKNYGRSYRNDIINRQALHAKLLGFIHPGMKIYMEFEAPLPADISNLINNSTISC